MNFGGTCHVCGTTGTRPRLRGHCLVSCRHARRHQKQFQNRTMKRPVKCKRLSQSRPCHPKFGWASLIHLGSRKVSEMIMPIRPLLNRPSGPRDLTMRNHFVNLNHPLIQRAYQTVQLIPKVWMRPVALERQTAQNSPQPWNYCLAVTSKPDMLSPLGGPSDSCQHCCQFCPVGGLYNPIHMTCQNQSVVKCSDSSRHHGHSPGRKSELGFPWISPGAIRKQVNRNFTCNRGDYWWHPWKSISPKQKPNKDLPFR